MIFIPKHISDLLTHLKSKLSIDPISPTNRFYYNELREIERDLNNYSSNTFHDKDLFVEIMKIAERIISLENQVSEYTFVPKKPSVIWDVEIDSDLKNKINLAQSTSPSLQYDLEGLALFIRNQPSTALDCIDSFCDFKEFKLLPISGDGRIAELSRIEKSFGKSAVCIDHLPETGELKRIELWFFEETTGSSYKPTGIAKEVKQHLMKVYEFETEDDFDAIRDAFELWFRIGRKGIYYVYIPQ